MGDEPRVKGLPMMPYVLYGLPLGLMIHSQHYWAAAIYTLLVVCALVDRIIVAIRESK